MQCRYGKRNLLSHFFSRFKKTAEGAEIPLEGREALEGVKEKEQQAHDLLCSFEKAVREHPRDFTFGKVLPRIDCLERGVRNLGFTLEDFDTSRDKLWWKAIRIRSAA